MTFFFALALIAFAVSALLWWALRNPGARPLVAVLTLALVPLPAAAAALDSIIAAATPALLELIGLMLTLIIGWAATVARKKWGIEIEGKHRTALHWALYTGAQLALRNELTGKAALDLILRYVRESVPDAIGSLKPTPELLTDLAKAKLQQVAAEQTKDATGDAVDKLAEALRRAGAQ